MKETKEQTLIIGIGGGGQNIVNRLSSITDPNIKLITINSDEQALNLSKVNRILFPRVKKFYKIFSKNSVFNMFKQFCNMVFSSKSSYGCGGDVIIGEMIGEKYKELLKKDILKSKRIFVISSFGRGFGTGVTPVVVDYIKSFNKKITVIATTPFSFEGKKRWDNAYTGVEKLKHLNEDFILINNYEILNGENENLSFNEALEKISNAVITKLVKNIDMTGPKRT